MRKITFRFDATLILLRMYKASRERRGGRGEMRDERQENRQRGGERRKQYKIEKERERQIDRQTETEEYLRRYS